MRGKGLKLDNINKDNIQFSYYLIAGKTMRHFTRNECILDTVSIAEHYCQGVILNWLAFVLNELFEACEDVYWRSIGFVLGYLVMALEMWKWRPPLERQRATIAEGQLIALKLNHGGHQGIPTQRISKKELSRDGMHRWWMPFNPWREYQGLS